MTHALQVLIYLHGSLGTKPVLKYFWKHQMCYDWKPNNNKITLLIFWQVQKIQRISLVETEYKQTSVCHLNGTLPERDFVSNSNKLSYSKVKEQVQTLRDVEVSNIIKYLNEFSPKKFWKASLLSTHYGKG